MSVSCWLVIPVNGVAKEGLLVVEKKEVSPPSLFGIIKSSVVEWCVSWWTSGFAGIGANVTAAAAEERNAVISRERR